MGDRSIGRNPLGERDFEARAASCFLGKDFSGASDAYIIPGEYVNTQLRRWTVVALRRVPKNNAIYRLFLPPLSVLWDHTWGGS